METYLSKQSVIGICTDATTFAKLSECWFKLSLQELKQFAIEFYELDGDNCTGDIQTKFVKFMNDTAESAYCRMNNLQIKQKQTFNFIVMKRYVIERNIYGDFIPVVSEVVLNKSDLQSMKELGNLVFTNYAKALKTSLRFVKPDRTGRIF